MDCGTEAWREARDGLLLSSWGEVTSMGTGERDMEENTKGVAWLSGNFHPDPLLLFFHPAHARTHPQVYWSRPWHLTAKPATQAASAVLWLFPLDPGAGTSSIFPQYPSSQRGLWRVGGWFGLFFLMWDLSSPTRDESMPPAVEEGSLNNQTAKEVSLPFPHFIYFPF